MQMEIKYIATLLLVASCGSSVTEMNYEFDATKTIFHIVSTGQSNSIGGGGEKALSLIPYRNNLKMTPMNQGWEPLIEPVMGHKDRGITETHAALMAQTVTERLDWDIVVSNSGEGGHSMRWIEKEGLGEAYSHSIEAVRKSYELAKENEKNLIVPAVVLIHGESDAIEGTKDYKERLIKLSIDYNNDIKELTGQISNVIMFVVLYGNNQGTENKESIHNQIKEASESSMLIKLAGEDTFEWQPDGVHHTNTGYQDLGEMLGHVISEYYSH